MTSRLEIKRILEEYKGNELIFASKLYREKMNQYLSEAAYYKQLERMYQKGELGKIAKGIYYNPVVTKYGMIMPSDKQIIDCFIKDNTGMIVGYTLYNNLNLTTQVSKTIDVLSSSLEGYSKKIRNIEVKYVDLDYSDEVVIIISGLEVLQNFNKIEDLNYIAFIEFSKKLAKAYQKDIFDEIYSKKAYKKSTISFFKDVLNYYGVSNDLDNYLSSLSTYKHPRMEEIYDIAQLS